VTKHVDTAKHKGKLRMFSHPDPWQCLYQEVANLLFKVLTRQILYPKCSRMHHFASFLPLLVSRGLACMIVSQLLLEQNIWQALVTSVPPYETFSLIKNNILHQSKIYKNHFENQNFWGMWPLIRSRWSCDIVSKLCCSHQQGFLKISSPHKFCR
jgi:hypothetical protein